MAGLEFGDRITADQQFQGPERLLMRQIDLFGAVAQGVEAGLGQGHVLLVADPDLVADLGQRQQLFG